MKITKTQLRKIIQEEKVKVLNELSGHFIPTQEMFAETFIKKVVEKVLRQNGMIPHNLPNPEDILDWMELKGAAMVGKAFIEIANDGYGLEEIVTELNNE